MIQRAQMIRRRLERVLNDAYGDGLLSPDTHAQRLDALLRGPVIDPSDLIGDLTIRPRPRRLVSTTLARGLRALRPAAAPPVAVGLLALDWTGGTPELLVGRSAESDIHLSDISVSRRHAQLSFRDGGWIVRDLDSTNGTTVNGTPVGRCRLLPGDQVAFGDSELLID